MNKYLLVVNSNPTDGNEAAYNDWYTNVHLSEMLQVPGFMAAQRYKFSDMSAAGDPPDHKYMAVYEMETDTPQVSLDVLLDDVANRMDMSEAIDMENLSAHLYGPITERVTE